MEKFEVIIVGAGLAGLSAAYTLAQNGIEAVVVERGDYPGAKNVTGGRLYLNPVKKYLPDLWPALIEEKALERPVAVELLTMMARESSTTLRFRAEEFARSSGEGERTLVNTERSYTERSYVVGKQFVPITGLEYGTTLHVILCRRR